MDASNPSPKSEEAAEGSLDRSSPKFDEADYRKRLSEEYKLLQDKIDRIGAFRFTIKGWAVTAVAGISAAASAVSNIQTAVLVSLSLMLLVLFFFLLEVEQIRLSRLFGDRAHSLEKLFVRMDRRKMTSSPIPVPHTAHEIARASYQRDLAERGQPPIRRLLSRAYDCWKIGRFAHRWFYLALLVLAGVPALRHIDEITQTIGHTASQIYRSVDSTIPQATPKPQSKR